MIATSTRRPQVRFTDLLASQNPLAFAHRGANMVAPENTFAAFRAALDMGFRILETDIQASRDGTLYAFHDKNAARLTGDARRFEALTDRQIDALRVRRNHRVPKLGDLLEEFADAYFNLDAKTPAAAHLLAPLLTKASAQHRVCIGSFNDRRISQILRVLPETVCHSVGIANAVRFYLGAKVGLGQRIGAGCVQLPMTFKGLDLITPRAIGYAHANGLKVHVWTLNEPAEIDRALDMGVDGVMSDDCGALKKVLIKRGQWASDY